MKTNNVRLLTAMTSILLVMSMPSIFAQSEPLAHSITPFPPIAAPNTFINIDSTLDPVVPVATADIVFLKFKVVHDTDFDYAADTNPLNCASNNPEANDRQWDFMTGGPGGIPARAIHNDVGVSISSIFFDSGQPVTGFGSGDPATTAIVGTAAFLDAGPYTWERRNSAGVITGEPDDTAVPGAYFAVGCAFVDLNEDRIWQQGAEPTNVIAESWLITTPVGGSSMSIENVPLLVAGVESNALWILPILGLAGTIIAIRKLEA